VAVSGVSRGTLTQTRPSFDVNNREIGALFGPLRLDDPVADCNAADALVLNAGGAGAARNIGADVVHEATA
jgi:hypothetical protein